MKHAIIAFGIAASIFISCNNDAEKKEVQIATPGDSVIKQRMTLPNDSVVKSITIGDNSFNSLDWPGTYKGIVLCADCEGIETTIVLGKDLFYSMTTKHLGKKASFPKEKKGAFSWNIEGNKISLTDIDNASGQYLVGENMLIQLDLNGSRITGESAKKYQLKKMDN